MRLVLMRHGQTHSNVAGALDTGAPGADLTELGIAQAKAAARVLQERDRAIEGVFASTLVRTQQTGQPFLTSTGLVPVISEGIIEIQAGDNEMKTDDDAVHTYIHTVAEWIHGNLSLRMPGGETGHEFLERYDGLIAETAAHEDALVISHGAAIRTWAAARTDLDSGRFDPTDPLHNTGTVELEGDPDSGWRVIRWQCEPLGGHYLEDPTAKDPTGQEADE